MRQLEWRTVSWLLGFVRDIDGLEMFLHWCHSENLKIEHEILKVPCYGKFFHPSYFTSRLPRRGEKNKQKKNSVGPENCFSFLLKLKFPHVWKQWRRRSQRRASSHVTHATHVARATFAHNTGPLKQKCFSDASSTTLAWSCDEAREVVQLSSSSRENEKTKKTKQS